MFWDNQQAQNQDRYCGLQVEVGSLSFSSPRLPAMYISQDCLLYSVCGSVEHSSLFHFVAFFNFSWDLFSTLRPPALPSLAPVFLTTPSADWISNGIMHLALWSFHQSKYSLLSLRFLPLLHQAMKSTYTLCTSVYVAIISWNVK